MKDFLKNWNLILKETPELELVRVHFHQAYAIRKYRLDKFWSINICDYQARVKLNDIEYPLHPGDIILMPPGTERIFFFQARPLHRVCHFKLPACPSTNIQPCILNSGKKFRRITEDFDNAVACFSSNPAKSTAIIWKLLWDLPDLNTVMETSVPVSNPLLHEVLLYIERHLSEPLKASELAARFNISHNHLTRLFNYQFFCGIIAFIRKRRMNLAKHLLTNSDLPIKEIACETGIPDLQRFNKIIRKELGCSPRQLRKKL
jgi:AraC-like DNA-binding protein